MKDFIKRVFGVEKITQYERDYLNDTNIRMGVYMSGVVAVLELWMIIRFILKYSIPRGYDLAETLSGMKLYLLLFAAAVVMLVFSLRYTFTENKHRTAGVFFVTVFALICVFFGVSTTLTDIGKGYQIICFLNMILFAACLLIWRPYISLLFLFLSFYIFGYFANLAFAENIVREHSMLIADGVTEAESLAILGVGSSGFVQNAVQALEDKGQYFFRWLSEPCMNKGDLINLATFCFCLAMICASNYMQRISEAHKDEKLVNAYNEIHKRSITDSLTQIANVISFSDDAGKLLKDVSLDPSEMAFVFTNIENFSNYNEKYGFEAGNVFLKKYACIFGEVFSGDIYARFSDDHFVAFSKTDTVEKKIADISRKIKSLESGIKMGIKAGGFVPSDRNTDPVNALDHARFACNTIRHRNDVSFQIFDERMEEDFRKKQYIINNIDDAIRNGYVRPYYQPVVWASDRTMCGMEALARWIDPKLGFLSPAAFIPVLEEYRQIHKLDACIMEKVCRDIRDRLNRNEPVVPVSVNFSRLDFELTDIVDIFEGFVAKYRIPKQYLHIEITESALTEQPEVLKENMARIREYGYSIWLDDFGSGYSSLNSLKDYRFDVMKIDMAFLKNFESSPKARPILEQVIKLADAVDMETLTEGVETSEQADFLKNAGCGRLQGYYFGKPMPAEDIEENIRNGKYIVSEHLFAK